MNLPKEAIVAWFPADRNTSISDNELHMLVATDFKFDEDENGNIVVSRNGQVFRDPLSLAPIAPQKVMENYFSERKWRPAPNVQGKSGSCLSKFEKDWAEQNPGKNTISPEFQADLEKHAKQFSDFDFYS